MISKSEQEKIDHIRECKEQDLNPFTKNPDENSWVQGVLMIEEFATYLENGKQREPILKRLKSKSPEFLDALIEFYPRLSFVKDNET